jgi:hypothetical protein
MKRLALAVSVASLVSVGLTTASAPAQPAVTVYSVCVGEFDYACPPCSVKAGPHMVCNGYDAHYDCRYASQPTEQVKVFCEGKGTKPTTWRTYVGGGNRCGYSVIGITCN